MARSIPRFAALLALVPLSVSCQDQGYTQLKHQDFFQQNTLQTVDVLLVVDNSCSMVEEQNKLATNFDTFIQYFTDANVDWQIGVVTTDMAQAKFSGRLIGGDDEIMLYDATGQAQDSVSYDKTWPVGPGVVFSLDPSYDTVTSNDSLDHWCTTVAATPGAPNPGCGGTGTGADDRLGSIVITEFVPDPDPVDDTLGEWFEVTNISATDVDLSGWSIADTGRNLYTVPDGTTIAAGGIKVFGRSADTSVNGGIPVDVAYGDAFTLNNHDLFITPQTDDPSEVFSEIVAQGTSGSGTEMGFEGAYAAVCTPADPPTLDCPLPLSTTENAGFVRDDANLSILVVSDENDFSPLSVADYLNGFVEVKGEAAYRDHSKMNISAVVGDTPPEVDGGPSCTSANGNAKYASRYVEAVSETGGLIDSICADDFSPIVNQLGLTLSGLQVDFALSRTPDPTTLAVSLYDSSGVTKIRDLTQDVDYSYVSETNSVHFDHSQIPPSQDWISVDYLIKSGS